ncbi:MAG: [protein-PII] uridylyltransferase [Gammaproteobacteria bacterium]|nr:[protein-PII] uridylyltransferase [Gammaproteobacteria bacterium]
MGAEIELAEENAAAVFSAQRVRGRLRADPRQPVASFRDTLGWGRERLVGLFHDGAPADALVHARSHLVDEALCEAWRRFVAADIAPDLALIAVGGYGRGELLPHSDIDLLLLYQPGALETRRGALEALFAFLWDIGLEVGSSVRSVEQCANLAAADVTVITNLLEARLLCGDAQLFDRLNAALQPQRMWPVDTFFRAKLEEQAQRHHKFDDTGYKLEPNVKEGPGGLRDIHTVAWVCKRHFGQLTLTELRDRGFLTKAECDELFAGQDFLWRVRFALHMITGRHEDRLLFDHQLRIAELFGYVDADHNRAVEQFMQLYYRTIKSLSCLNDMLLQLFDEAILQRGAETPLRPLNTRFATRGGYLEVRDEQVFRQQPLALLEAFALWQKHPEITGIRAQTLRLIRRDARFLTEVVRGDVNARRLFISMFQHGEGLTRTLRRMNRYGVLGRYLPEFDRVVGHMQYDLFHTLTVDEHSLHVVRNLRRLAIPRFADELPFFSRLFAGEPRPELLYVAGLFHDLAKGRGGDHSALGADDARAFCLMHGFSHPDAEDVAWLVRHHLMMSLTAQRQDISDPRIVTEFATRIGTRQRLDRLLLLTVADIRATNPVLWNSWRESLLKELYFGAVRALERGLENPISQSERIAEIKRAAVQQLEAGGLDAVLIGRIWARFEDDYFLRHTPAELAWHLPAIAAAQDADLPLILAEAQAGRGGAVFVYMRDRDRLFALTAGVLAQIGLSILDARIHTSADGYTLDSWAVCETDGAPLAGAHRLVEIRNRLREVLADPKRKAVEINRLLPRRLRHFAAPTHVSFRPDSVRSRTMIELVTMDRPGLLAVVGRVFARRGIRIDAAKIGTIGERAEDVFFVTDAQRRPITDPRLLQNLRDVLQRSLDHVATRIN